MNKLIYFSDPMCSWCYGFKPELEKLINNFNIDFDLEIVMGGLRPGGGQPWDDEYKYALRSHWDSVHIASGQPFSYKLLAESNFNYNTEPACRAVCVVKKIDPGKTFDFFNKVQHMFYAEGEDPTVENFYKPILNTLEIDQTEFFDLFRSEEGYLLTEMDFRKTVQFKVNGFPTLLAEISDHVYPISKGFGNYQMLKDRLNTLLLQN